MVSGCLKVIERNQPSLITGYAHLGASFSSERHPSNSCLHHTPPATCTRLNLRHPHDGLMVESTSSVFRKQKSCILSQTVMIAHRRLANCRIGIPTNLSILTYILNTSLTAAAPHFVSHRWGVKLIRGPSVTAASTQTVLKLMIPPLTGWVWHVLSRYHFGTFVNDPNPVH